MQGDQKKGTREKVNKKIRAKNITIANKKARRVVGSDHTVTSVKVLKRTKARFGRKLYSVTYRKRKVAGKKVSGKVKRLRKFHVRKRGKRAVAVDRSKQARRTFSPKSRKGVKKWKKHPERYDIRGVDTKLKRARIKAREVVKKAKKDIQVAKKQYVQKKKQISKQKVSPKVKKERKAVAKREYKQKAKVIKKDTDKKIEKTYEPVKKEAKVRTHKFKAPWTRERRRRAQYVSKTTGASVIESDALIKRANSKGHDYDTYDWDKIQGKDLTYHERVGKMESGIGKTTTPSQEYQEVASDEAKFKQEMRDYYNRQAYEEERIYQRESEAGRR